MGIITLIVIVSINRFTSSIYYLKIYALKFSTNMALNEWFH